MHMFTLSILTDMQTVNRNETPWRASINPITSAADNIVQIVVVSFTF